MQKARSHEGTAARRAGRSRAATGQTPMIELRAGRTSAASQTQCRRAFVAGPAHAPLALLALCLGLLGGASTAFGQGFEDAVAGDPALRGIAMPIRRVELNAPLSGTVAEVGVQEGQTIEADAVLARMESDVQEAVVKAAELRAGRESELKRAKLQLEEAEVKLESTKEAFEKGAAEDWEVRRARVERDLAEVAVEAAKEATEVAAAELALERQRLERFTLRAPWAGYVSRVVVDPGATVSGEAAIMQLIDLATLKAEFNLPADLYDQIVEGRRYMLRAERPVESEVAARCTLVTRMIDPASETFRCVMRIDNPRGELPAGFGVRLIWPQPTEEQGQEQDGAAP